MSRRFNRRPLTEAERDARRQADRDRIEQAARQLLTTEGWQRWIKVRATHGLSRYSLRNQWIISSACYARGIAPTYVAGCRAFLALNRCVRKGEVAIKILAPVAVKQRDEHGENTAEKRIFFRTVSVWDVAMTDPLPGKEPIPLTPPARPITGDSHQHLVARLEDHAGELGYSVEIRELPDDAPGGWCDPQHKQIVVAHGPANRQVRTLVHELAHAHGLGYEQYGREQAEVLVDCVTYCVLGAVGLDVGGESIPTSPAGAKTAPSMRSENTRRPSTRSRAASKAHSSQSPCPRAGRSLLRPSRRSTPARSVGVAAPPR